MLTVMTEKISTSRVLILLTLIVAMTYILYLSSAVVLIGLIGIGIGVLLAPLLTFSQRRFRLPRPLSAVFIFVLLLLLFIGLGEILVFLVSDQLTKLSASAPQILQNLKTRLAELSNTYPSLEAQIQSLNLQESLTAGMDNVLYGVKSGVFAISSLAIAIFLGLYTAVDSDEYFDGLIHAFPPSKQARTREVLGKIAKSLRVWFRAQLVDMAIIGVSMGIVLRLVGMEYWAVFAVLTAVLCIIPYAGILIVIVLAALVTLASDPARVPFVVAAIFLVQQLEANVVLPRVMRDQAELPEVPLLIFMLMLGGWFGIVGVFVAPALFAIVKTLYHEIYQPWIGVPPSQRMSQPETPSKTTPKTKGLKA
jgi:predicted PurR-regulated permease PerM